MNKVPHYMKVVEWSEEDRCFIGSAPPLIGQCCHGDDEVDVYRQLSAIVADWIDTIQKDGKPLPDAPSKQYSGRFVIRVSPDIHKAIAIRAMQDGRSLNSFVEQALEKAV